MSANLKRRHLTESQRALLGARLEAMYAEGAKERQRAGQRAGGYSRQGDTSLVANLPPSSKARDEAAREVGVSPRSVQTAKTVLQQGAPALIEAVEAGKVSVSTAAALSQAPKEEQAELVARGKKEILQAAKAIRQAEGEKRRRERTEHLAKLSASSAKDLGSLGRFPVLYADPPWRYTQHRESSRSVENHYPTMEVEEICALGVDQLATEDAVLFLWATAPLLPEALRVLASWGFDYKTSWVWDKEHPGMGNWGRIQHELILIATRGRHPTPAPEARPPSVFRAPRTEHSKKPSQVRAAIEGMFPSLPRVELFARGEAPPGWVFWGNQAAS